MAQMYDLMLLLDPNAPDDRHEQVIREVESMIESGGTIVGSYDWGNRRLAYEIDHRPEATYHLFQIETDDNGVLERLQQSLRIMDGVLRFRLIRLRPGAPPPPPTPEPSRIRREEEPAETRVAARAAADASPERD